MSWSQTIFLKLPSEAEWSDLSGLLEGHAVDVVGTLYNEAGEPSEGFHVNVRMKDGAELPEALVPFVVTPANPKRDFA